MKIQLVLFLLPFIVLMGKDPFDTFYQKGTMRIFSLEGKIRSLSPLPDPQKNDYPDCLYSAMVEVDSFSCPDNADQRIAKEIIVNIPVMRSKKIFVQNVFRAGDKISVKCVQYDIMPEKIRNIQVSDSFQSFEHDYFYVIDAKKIRIFSNKGRRDFSNRKISILPIKVLPADENAARLRKERIAAEIAKIEAELKTHGNSFAQWKKEYEPIALKYKKLSAERYSAWLKDSFYSAGDREMKYDTKNYIKSILPYKKYLESKNIDLIILRIPSKGDFAARVLASDTFVENPYWIEHYYECLKNDIEIVDPMPEMYAHRYDFPLFYFYNNPDGHPFEGNSFISAKVLAKILERYPYEKTEEKITLSNFLYKTKDKRYFYPPGNEKFDPQKNISFRRVMQKGKHVGALSPYGGSVFLFLSNSFFYYPSRPMGASLPAYTAFFIQHIPDWFYQNGTGNGLLRSLLSDTANVLSGRRVVIMVGYPWPKMPPLPKHLLANATSVSLEKTIDKFGDEIKITGKKAPSVEFKNNLCVVSQKKRDDSFFLELTVPAVKNKTTCMVRVNCQGGIHASMIAFDGNDDSVLEPFFYVSDASSADMFVPLQDTSRKIKIKISHTRLFYLKNIELWYF